MATQVHPHFDREERTDPITGHTIEDTEGHPWLQEGDADEGLTVYFDTEESMREYAAIGVEHPEQGMEHTMSNPDDLHIAEG